VFITTNSRLLIAIEGDKSAWQRRLVIIPFERMPVAKVIPNFARLLVQEEGTGIFAWAVQGAVKLRHDIKEHGAIAMDAVQRQRVRDVLLESDSIMSFLTRRTVADPKASAHTATLFRSYQDFCASNGFESLQERIFERRVRGELLDLHGAQYSENVILFNQRRRGYIGVRVLGGPELDVGAGL
jgi:putative DNA primase/helicase